MNGFYYSEIFNSFELLKESFQGKYMDNIWKKWTLKDVILELEYICCICFLG